MRRPSGRYEMNCERKQLLSISGSRVLDITVLRVVSHIDPDVDQNLLSTLRNSFDDSTHSDVEFIVQGKSIHVHKAILKIR